MPTIPDQPFDPAQLAAFEAARRARRGAQAGDDEPAEPGRSKGRLSRRVASWGPVRAARRSTLAYTGALELGPPTTSSFPLIDGAPRITTAAQKRDIRTLLRGSLYSGLVPRPPPEQYPISEVMGFALDLAEAMLRAGANGRDTEVAVVAITATWELAPLELEITTAAVRLQYSPAGEAPITEMRIVRNIGSDLSALSRIYRLVDEIVAGDIDMAGASRRLDIIESLGPRWSAPYFLLANGVLGITLSFLAGGDWRSAIGAFVLVLAAMGAGLVISRYAVPSFFTVAAQSAIGLALGTTTLALGWLSPGQTASAVAPLLVLLLPHPAIVAFAQDAITGFRDPANARGLSIALVVLGVLLGMPAGLVITSSWFHVEVDPTRIELVPLTLPWALLASTVAALANAVGQGAAGRTMPMIAVAAAVTSCAQRAFLAFGFTALFATFAAATVLGVICTLAAARMRTAVLVLAVPAYCGALLPALAVAYSLLNLVAGTPQAGYDFATAMLSTLGIGAGLVLGTQLATPSVRRLVARHHQTAP